MEQENVSPSRYSLASSMQSEWRYRNVQQRGYFTSTLRFLQSLQVLTQESLILVILADAEWEEAKILPEDSSRTSPKYEMKAGKALVSLDHSYKIIKIIQSSRFLHQPGSFLTSSQTVNFVVYLKFISSSKIAPINRIYVYTTSTTAMIVSNQDYILKERHRVSHICCACHCLF